MLSTIGLPGLLLIIFVVLIFFGPRKLPELGRSFGTTLKEFKDSTRGVFEESDKHTVEK
ncbi:MULTISPECIES: twin-arginine translocase TatA/TatE family subunit [unclassified Paenibacillus]|uniref:twin-arginine translocase TatA/TatE family subunit n=1 Tax=unclassified Paenibacillus TaxID=185978 RepID=UPI000AFE2301|nr:MULTISPECIES: twin-arginine translocase TatA/TatE family subunit [unclassified Paenibacillus]